MIIKSKNPRIFFISDVHLGVPDAVSSLEREKRLVIFLESIRQEATDLVILGDLFDMWFDYKRVAPRGYYRILAKLAEFTDQGIHIHYFTGNHDMWVFNYLRDEINFKLYNKIEVFECEGKRFMLGHGDGVGPGDFSYKLVKRVFAGKLNQWLFARLHPNFGLGLALKLSAKSRISNGNFEEQMGNIEEEALVKFCRKQLETHAIDYFVFGHRHVAFEHQLNEKSKYINLGEWVKKPHYAVFDGSQLLLMANS